jgi:hypothetical protein
MKSEDLDRAFDAGEAVLQHFNLDHARRPNLGTRRIHLDLPAWMVDGLDARAAHLGITRQALIEMWIAERLD